MIKITKLFFINALFFTALQADLSSPKYTSIYSDRGGLAKANTYDYKDGFYSVFIASIPYESEIDYKNNFAFFLPNFTKKYSIHFGRVSSKGWMDIFVSLGKKPFLGEKNKFAEGNYGVSLKNFEPSPFIYTDTKNKFYFAPLTSHSSIWFDKVTSGWTLGMWNLKSINWHGDVSADKTLKLNKWLYFATDPRPTSFEDNKIQSRSVNSDKSIKNILEYLVYYVSLRLDKVLVDNEVQKNALDNKFYTKCMGVPENAKNVCYYMNAFGNADVSQNFNSAKEYNKHKCKTGTKTVSIPLKKGWNFIGSSETFFYIDNKNKKGYSFKDGIWLGEEPLTNQPITKISIQKGESAWVYANEENPTPIHASYCQDDIKKSVLETKTLDKGWHMLNSRVDTTPEEVISGNLAKCVYGIYLHDNSDSKKPKWLTYDNSKKEIVDLKAGQAFWINISENNCLVKY